MTLLVPGRQRNCLPAYILLVVGFHQESRQRACLDIGTFTRQDTGFLLGTCRIRNGFLLGREQQKTVRMGSLVVHASQLSTMAGSLRLVILDYSLLHALR